MATLHIADFPDAVHDRLCERASRHGASPESEARAILEQALAVPAPARPAASLQELVDRLYADSPPTDAVAELIAERRREAALE